MADLIAQQKKSTDLVLNGAPVMKLFVDGGFSKNQVFMHLLAKAYPQKEVFAATVPQSTALGAALAIHNHWNSKPIPAHLVQLKKTDPF
jgi:sugar (pentulose or hexulose) kinase